MDATAQHIKACAKAAELLGEPTCLTKINGVLVTVHAPVPPRTFESRINNKTVAMQMLIAKCGHRHSLRKDLHSAN